MISSLLLSVLRCSPFLVSLLTFRGYKVTVLSGGGVLPLPEGQPWVSSAETQDIHTSQRAV